jgi:hypothetical protein
LKVKPLTPASWFYRFVYSFNPEDGGNMFLRNVIKVSMEYAELDLRKSNSSNDSRENNPIISTFPMQIGVEIHIES